VLDAVENPSRILLYQGASPRVTSPKGPRDKMPVLNISKRGLSRLPAFPNTVRFLNVCDNRFEDFSIDDHPSLEMLELSCKKIKTITFGMLPKLRALLVGGNFLAVGRYYGYLVLRILGTGVSSHSNSFTQFP
jgi:hypothetical protein